MKANTQNNSGKFVLAILLFIAAIIVLCYKIDNYGSDSSSSKIYMCRHVGCGFEALYPDWNRRFCSIHIKGTRTCSHPGCTNQVPNSSYSKYCSEHIVPGM